MFAKHQSSASLGQAPPIQLIFRDLQMPICDGIDATQQIRLLEEENKWASSILFIVTGQDSPGGRSAAVGVGAHDFFCKTCGN
ncbi:hypothetical protein QBC44DRAFT_253343 [Cladorrhinum sp. PSN332]|nr:hypothetical protein QBC44DRAFT_253343 [Cladorrhinum sp. PSN332]